MRLIDVLREMCLVDGDILRRAAEVVKIEQEAVLGNYLIAHGHLTREDLDVALSVQASHSRAPRKPWQRALDAVNNAAARTRGNRRLALALRADGAN